MRTALLLALLLAFPGCLGDVFKTPPACPAPSLHVVPDPNRITPPDPADPRAPLHSSRSPAWLVLTHTNFTGDHQLRLASSDFGHLKRVTNYTTQGVNIALVSRISSQSVREPTVTAELSDHDYPPGCRGEGVASQAFLLRDTTQGRVIVRGAGALVYTVGFWENGTMFYTNLPEAHNQTHWPRAGWYNYTSGDPLKVYVYNQTRTEMPKRYKDAGYTGTIEGFNAALKGLREKSPTVVYVAPELAYTLPQYAGNATAPRHRLYGQALYFYIEVAQVSTVPCPFLTGPLCEQPTAPLDAPGPGKP